MRACLEEGTAQVLAECVIKRACHLEDSLESYYRALIIGEVVAWRAQRPHWSPLESGLVEGHTGEPIREPNRKPFVGEQIAWRAPLRQAFRRAASTSSWKADYRSLLRAWRARRAWRAWRAWSRVWHSWKFWYKWMSEYIRINKITRMNIRIYSY